MSDRVALVAADLRRRSLGRPAGSLRLFHLPAPRTRQAPVSALARAAGALRAVETVVRRKGEGS